jgi:hypothetical protein
MTAIGARHQVLRLALLAAAILIPSPRWAPAEDLASTSISGYRVETGWLAERGNGRRLVAIRSFTLGRRPYRLTVDPNSLQTAITQDEAMAWSRKPWKDLRAELAETPYGRALTDALRCGGAQRDCGLSHVRSSGGIDLTIDLCPSHHPLDRRLFRAIVDEVASAERPVPVAIAATGLWLVSHGDDLTWLLALEREGALAITWVNHSYHHRVNAEAPPSRQFLLAPGTNLRGEILDTEAAFLSRGLLPSVFFRCPGLVASPNVLATIVDHGLVPLGSDAWLGKGQAATPGSIVLLHGNGNEPLGVRRFLELLRTERDAVRAGRWLLLDLRQTVGETEADGLGPAAQGKGER